MKAIKSKAQAAKFYADYKKGKISYAALMAAVHASGDMKKLPTRVPKKTVDKKTALAIKGLI